MKNKKHKNEMCTCAKVKHEELVGEFIEGQKERAIIHTVCGKIWLH